MPGFFDFLLQTDVYGEDPKSVARLNRRHDFIVAPFAKVIAGARILDLASHDGRWAYAFAAAAAREVVGIEGRAELIDRFATFPENDAKSRVSLRQGDIFDELEALKTAGETFDVVAIFGVFYHITEHYRLILLVQALKPKLILIDSEFIVASDGPIVRFMREETSKPLNALPRAESHDFELVATPSLRLVEVFGEVTGYSVEWIDWAVLPEDQRDGLGDYFRDGAQRRRGTAVLRPLEEARPTEKQPRRFLDPRSL